MLNLRDPKVTHATYGISLNPISHMAFAVPPTGTT